MDELAIQMIDQTFSVCKVENYDGIDIEQPFVFTGSTDEEKSLVCPESMVPSKTIECDDGWRGFRIVGQLDFSLIGILSRISEILASSKIGIFAVSTYNTDYIFVKKENYEKALDELKNAGYRIVSAGVLSGEIVGTEEALEYYLKGLVEFDNQNYSAAIELFELSNSKDEHFKTYERLYSCWLKLSDTKKAYACIEKAYYLNPQNDKTAFEYAETLVESGDTDHALEVLDDILQRNPSFKKAQVLQEEIISK
ncbi:MAG: ACT domain-containing protein [Eubacterium sp.]|nr:ACT domain-containing protein [Eubacterium sp.]